MTDAGKPSNTRRKKPPAAARVHPDQRANIEGLNAMAAIVYGKPSPNNPISYYTPELIQCTLPHSDPKERDWIRSSGPHTLIISSGIDKTGAPFGIPYGSFPRMVLAYIITRVVESGERRIEFQSYFRTFLKEVGYTTRPSVRHLKTLKNGLERLLYATITYEYEEKNAREHGRARRQFTVAPDSMLFWSYVDPDQGGLWDSVIEISEKFHSSIINAPVPLRTDMLSALRKSPLAIDLYMWLSYRLYTLQQNGEDFITLSYGSLQTQFGTGIASDNYRNFRHELRHAFEKVKRHWERLSAADGKPGTIHCDMDETTITLYRSPLLIAPSNEKKNEKSAFLKKAAVQAILTSRKFDTVTLRKARQLAGTWDVNILMQRYFAWIDEKSLTPENPEAHFLNFVRSHVARNH
jgi:hypothetical protein